MSTEYEILINRRCSVVMTRTSSLVEDLNQSIRSKCANFSFDSYSNIITVLFFILE